MEASTIVDINSTIIGIVGSVIAWGGFLLLVVVLRNFIVAGISRAFIQVFESATDKTKETLVRYLVDKNATIEEIYENLKKHFERQGS
ncbi:hypothetical protein MYX06_02855 [Patescibacteria group bacterium AH-259-L05]|nr:hypothetical protein [Patescibacteria group bacterium AH-259-L05]